LTLGAQALCCQSMLADPVIRVLAALEREALRRKFGLRDD
jgi:hypothetical protein